MKKANLDILKIKKKDLFLNAMGISNLCKDPKTKKTYSVQFFDFDMNEGQKLSTYIKYIKTIFPYDCIMYETKHGIQFISFALLKGSAATKARALSLVKLFKNQDY